MEGRIDAVPCPERFQVAKDEFDRAFPLERVGGGEDRDQRFRSLVEANPWLADLLHHWRVAGTADEALPHLRLAVRNGYLNFYRRGQSAAKVRLGRTGEAHALVHEKYLGPSPDGAQRYLRVDRNGIGRTTGAEAYVSGTHRAGWFSGADSHKGYEKTFVDEVVAANSDVIDLEMALPAGMSEVRTAPRIDLVALETEGTGWRIVLWEAKLADDGRLRRQGEAMPEVVSQLQSYTDWLGRTGTREAVVAAYRSTCELLVELHRLAVAQGATPGPLGSGIQAVAAGAPLSLDPAVRLLVDNRPTGEHWRESFKANGHQAKLEQAGLHVQVVLSGADMVLGRSK